MRRSVLDGYQMSVTEYLRSSELTTAPPDPITITATISEKPTRRSATAVSMSTNPHRREVQQATGHLVGLNVEDPGAAS